MNDKIFSLQLIRIIGFMFVFVSHLKFLIPSDVFASIPIGRRGVELLLMLSGFLIGYKYFDFFQTNNKIKDSFLFVWAHLKKFYLPFLLTSVICIGLLYTDFHFYFQNKFNLIRYFTLTHPWSGASITTFIFNPVAWFLGVLLFCYFLAPKTLALIGKIKTPRGLLTTAILIMLLKIIAEYVLITHYKIEDETYFFYLFPPYRFLEFFIGLCLGTLFLKHSKVFYNQYLDVFQIFAILIYFGIILSTTWIRAVYTPLTALLIFFFAYHQTDFIRLIKNKVLLFFAELNLYFYLTHWWVIMFIRKRHYINKLDFDASTIATECVVAFVASVIFSIVIRKICSIIYFMVNKFLKRRYL